MDAEKRAKSKRKECVSCAQLTDKLAEAAVAREASEGALRAQLLQAQTLVVTQRSASTSGGEEIVFLKAALEENKRELAAVRVELAVVKGQVQVYERFSFPSR